MSLGATVMPIASSVYYILVTLSGLSALKRPSFTSNFRLRPNKLTNYNVRIRGANTLQAFIVY